MSSAKWLHSGCKPVHHHQWLMCRLCARAVAYAPCRLYLKPPNPKGLLAVSQANASAPLIEVRCSCTLGK